MEANSRCGSVTDPEVAVFESSYPYPRNRVRSCPRLDMIPQPCAPHVPSEPLVLPFEAALGSQACIHAWKQCGSRLLSDTGAEGPPKEGCIR